VGGFVVEMITMVLNKTKPISFSNKTLKNKNQNQQLKSEQKILVVFHPN